MYRQVMPLILMILLAGCAGSTPMPEPQTAVANPDSTLMVVETVDPTGYVSQINNAFMPLTPGLTYIYEGTVDGKTEHVEIFVTHETRTVMDVVCTVVRETVSVNGQKVEETYDWYAQDFKGNVWYFGEDSRTFENGIQVSTEGSWEAGVDGAEAGIIMHAFPKVGDTYLQENYPGVAEDQAEVLSVTESVAITFSPFENVLKTKEWSPLEPGHVEHKYYAAGIGFILMIMAEGGEGRIELIEIRVEPPAQ